MSLVTTPSNVLTFVDGIPLPATVSNVEYSVVQETLNHTTFQGSLTRPSGDPHIEMEMLIEADMPRLSMHSLLVVSDDFRWTFIDPTIVSSHNRQIDESTIVTTWDLVAESVGRS